MVLKNSNLTNVVIPMAGYGQRFIDKSYLESKINLKLNNQENILSKNIKNFKGIKVRYIFILSDKKVAEEIKKNKLNINFKIIYIQKHKQGPLKTLFLGLKQLNSFIKKNEKIFLVYSDIIWKWDIKAVLKFVKKKKYVVFTHFGFHPHLEVNSKSDFCKVKSNIILNVKKKETFDKDYKKNHLAIGIYFFRDLSLIKNFFDNKFYFKKDKEYYFIDFINKILKKNKVYIYNLNKFAHLGFPEQYEDFLKWSFYFKKNNTNKNRLINFFRKFETVMLAGGQGKRMKNILKDKFFLKVNNLFFYKKIFDEYFAKKRTVITNKKIKSKLKKDNIIYFPIKQTLSMFQTLVQSKTLLSTKKNFFLTSCDCIGDFDRFSLRQLITTAYSDIIFFGFNTSYMQSKLKNSHSYLVTKNKSVINIQVKQKPTFDKLGHAGFFWIKDGKIFQKLNSFKKSKYYIKLKREPIIDDYFKFLLVNKYVRASFIELSNYLHLGSENEFMEFSYWKGFFREYDKK